MTHNPDYKLILHNSLTSIFFVFQSLRGQDADVDPVQECGLRVQPLRGLPRHPAQHRGEENSTGCPTGTHQDRNPGRGQQIRCRNLRPTGGEFMPNWSEKPYPPPPISWKLIIFLSETT
jgi:hypothetical protein